MERHNVIFLTDPTVGIVTVKSVAYYDDAGADGIA
jgi:hypothetical protein